MMKKILCCFFMLGSGISGFLKSQSADSGSISEIQIESRRIVLKVVQSGRNISIVDSATLRTLPVKSLPEILSWVGGMDVRQRGPWGSQADVSIQGGTFDQSLVLIDGVRVSDPQTGHNQMNLPVPIEMIDHIEVLKGPAARIYGINALTGAINIVTRKIYRNAAWGRLYTGGSGQTDTATGKQYISTGGGISAALKEGKFSQVLSTGWDQGTGYRYNTAFTNSRYYSRTEFAINSYQNLSFSAGYIYNSFGGNAFYAAPYDAESHETVQTSLASIQYRFKNEKWQILPRISYRYNYDNYIFKRNNPDYYHNRHFTKVYNGEINVSRVFNFGQMGLGAEYRRDEISSNNLGKRNRDFVAVSADILYNQIKNLIVVGGIYVVNQSAYGTRLFPGIEMSYQVNKIHGFFANAGSAQRIPTYTDLYYKGPSNISNPNLKPETSIAYEGGYRLKLQKVKLQATYFSRDIQNLIDWVKDSLGAPWSPVNYNTSRTTGYEISGVFPLWQHVSSKFFRNLSIRGSYTHLNLNFINQSEKSYSKNAVEILRDQLLFQLITEPVRNLQVSAGGRLLKRSNMNQYMVWDARVQYQVKLFSFFTDVTNIGNTIYHEITTVPLPPRWFNLGFRVSLN